MFRLTLVLLCLLGSFNVIVGQQKTGSLRGQVSDELGALVVGATVTLIAADGTQKTAVTNNEGTYTFNSLAPGQYTIRVAAPGFTSYEKTELAVAAGPRTTHDIRLVITLEKQVITVNEEQGLNVDPAKNADALVLNGQDLDISETNAVVLGVERVLVDTHFAD